jgi:hypothetical protein
MKDLRKVIIADQAEIKELRSKVQAADQVRSQLASRHEEVEQLKRSLQKIELIHKAEITSKDLRIAQQEKSLTLESRRREGLQQQIETSKSKTRSELNEAQACISSLQLELHDAKQIAAEVSSAASEAKQYQNNVELILARTAEAYGQLAASSISSDVHRESELTCASLRLWNIRLERRLADRDALIAQLTDYCRQASEANAFQARFTRDIEECYNSVLSWRSTQDDGACSEDSSIIFDWLDSREYVIREHHATMKADLDLNREICTLYRAQLDGLLVAYAMADHETGIQSSIASYLNDNCTSLQNQAETLRMAKATAETVLAKLTIHASEAQTREQLLNQRLTVQKNECIALEDALCQARESASRLAHANYLGKKREEALGLETKRLDFYIRLQRILIF